MTAKVNTASEKKGAIEASNWKILIVLLVTIS
jgi:hypothetical protein